MLGFQLSQQNRAVELAKGGDNLSPPLIETTKILKIVKKKRTNPLAERIGTICTHPLLSQENFEEFSIQLK